MSKTAASLVWILALLLTAAAIAAVAWNLLAPRVAVGTAEAQSGVPDTAALALIAEEIRPVIMILERYRGEHQMFPLHSSDLDGQLPAGTLADDLGDTISLDIGGGRVWVYERDPDGQSYELTRKLKDGGSLSRVQDGTGSSWMFSADGEEDPVDIDIAP